MVSKYLKSRVKRGASDLIVVLALIAVAIPVALAVQNWLTSQVGRIATYSVSPTLLANIVSIEYRNDNATIIVSLTNNGNNDLNLTADINVVVVFGNGTTVRTRASPLTGPPTGKNTLRPGEEEILLITLTRVSSRINTLVIEVKDVAGNNHLVKVNTD